MCAMNLSYLLFNLKNKFEFIFIQISYPFIKICIFRLMKKFYTLSFLLINILLFCQTKALTEDGKDVLLLDNGTWRYVNLTDSLALQMIKTNPTLFAKSKASTFQIKSKKLDIGLYLNTKIWRISTQTKSPFTEYVFNDVHDENALGAFMMTEKVQIPTLKNLKDIILTGV